MKNGILLIALTKGVLLQL